MNEFFVKLLKGALSGLLAAAAVDMHAFLEGPDQNAPFDWKIAGKRYAGGAFFGALAASGLSGLAG